MKKNYCLLLLISIILFINCSNKKQKVNGISKSKYSVNELNGNLIQSMEEKNYKNAAHWISKGANPNLSYRNQSLLSYCTYKNITDLSKILIEAGADINWIDPSDHVSVFSNVIFNNNLELGKYFLSHNIDLSYKDYSGFNYFEKSIFDKNDKENKFYNDYRFAYLLLQNSVMKKIVQEDKGTMYAIIRNWSSEMPSIIESIYGTDYIFPDSPPVILIAITEIEIDAVKYFISKNISTKKEYYEPDFNEYYTPLDFADFYYREIIHNSGRNSIYAKKIEDICILLEKNKDNKWY